MQRLSGGGAINIIEDTGAVDTIITGQAGDKKPSIEFVQDKNIKRDKEKVNIVIREENPKEEKKAEGKRGAKIKEVSAPKPPKEIDLGAGIVQEGRRGRRHIKF